MHMSLHFSSLQFSLVAEVKQNLNELVEEWKSLQQELLSASPSSSPSLSSTSSDNQLVPCPNELPLEVVHGEGASGDKSLGRQMLLVRRSDLEKLSTEAMMLKEFLPKVLNHEYVAMIGKLSHVEQGKYASEKHRFVCACVTTPNISQIHPVNFGQVTYLVHSDDLHRSRLQIYVACGH